MSPSTSHDASSKVAGSDVPIINVNTRLQEVLEEHFDPRWGAPFWLRKRSELGFDPRREITTIGDIGRLGPMPTELLATLPVEDFIPRKFHDRLNDFVLAETGGTTGPPKRTAYLQEEFEEAFVRPFVTAATRIDFPRESRWLYIGPSGPHIIGKAARACAAALGSMDPFAVDFDPRWIRKLPAGSMAHTRYVEHVLSQAEAVLTTQGIGVLFATPPVLTRLGERLPRAIRNDIRGVHLGGLPSDPSFLEALDRDWFPNATVLGGYGNSLAGLCPQLSTTADGKPEYFPHGRRLFVDVFCKPDAHRGQVIFHRLDRSCFLPNVFERDEAERVELDPKLSIEGFQRYGLRDPRPPAAKRSAIQSALY